MDSIGIWQQTRFFTIPTTNRLSVPRFLPDTLSSVCSYITFVCVCHSLPLCQTCSASVIELCLLIEHFVWLIRWHKCDETPQTAHTPLAVQFPHCIFLDHDSKSIVKISLWMSFHQALNQQRNSFHEYCHHSLACLPLGGFFFFQSLQHSQINMISRLFDLYVLSFAMSGHS